MTFPGILLLCAMPLVAQTVPPLGQLAAPSTRLAEAQQLLQAGNLGGAEKTARSYIASNPQSADAHYLLGKILFLKKSPTASLNEFTEAAKYRQPTTQDLVVVASDYVLLGDYPDADKWFTKVTEWAPDDMQGWYYLGRTKYNENRFEEAVSAFQRCLQLDPKNVKAEDNLGLSYAGLGHNEEAVAAYHKAIDWQGAAVTKDHGPYLDLGTLLVDTNRPQEAIPYLLQAAELAPNDTKVHNQLGKAYLHTNQLGKAQGELEQAVALAPNNAPEHFMLGQIYRRQGKEDKAKQELARFTALNGAQSTDRNGVH